MGLLSEHWAGTSSITADGRCSFAWRSLLWLGAVAVAGLYLQFGAAQSWHAHGVSTPPLSPAELERLAAGLHTCRQWTTTPTSFEAPVAELRENPRWRREDDGSLLLRNATLFDGETWLSRPVDIQLARGVVQSVTPASAALDVPAHTVVVDVQGRHVTPGLVDMHSHHFIDAMPNLKSTSDDNEFGLGPLLPFLRAQHALKPYDPGARLILSGGVTSSLVLPGSANIIGGEAILVKNAQHRGPGGEDTVSSVLLEDGIPAAARRRYMKLACGENPNSIWGHVRTGYAWLLREHLHRASDLRARQDDWCRDAVAADAAGDRSSLTVLAALGLPEDFALESSVALLRGQIAAHIHCYETEDMETMLDHADEFGFVIHAFHHALEAWKAPEMLKTRNPNITIATFAEFGGFKKEAYSSNLWAGGILAGHGLAVAYKSDHFLEELNARYLMFQASTAHAFHLPEHLALQAVTSVPARSLRINHRVGYVRPGYDADLVVWNTHPLLLGATPLQVYVDGYAELDEQQARAMAGGMADSAAPLAANALAPRFRPTITPDARDVFCGRATRAGDTLVLTGIHTSFLAPDRAGRIPDRTNNITLVVHSGEVICFGSASTCSSAARGGMVVALADGYILPGLTAVSVALGMAEMNFDDNTGDGSASTSADPLDATSVVLATYGVHLDGKYFARARIGGTTRAVTPPLGGGLVKGVSVAISTIDNRLQRGCGIIRDEVALHVQIGQIAKETQSVTTVSSAIRMLRHILLDNHGKENVYGRVANGSLPLAVHVENKDAIRQMIMLKSDFPIVHLVLIDAAEAPLVAKELAAAQIPVIFTRARAAPDAWEKKDVVDGPPLTTSGVSLLKKAGVQFGISINGFSDTHIHNLLLEASWAAKYAGLTESEAVSLVSRNVEQILRLDTDAASRDFVVYEGNPLEFGASPVLMVDGRQKRVLSCWPTAI